MDFTDGVKIYDDSGWTLIRPSGTEKIIRIFSESKNMDDAVRYNNEYLNYLKSL